VLNTNPNFGKRVSPNLLSSLAKYYRDLIFSLLSSQSGKIYIDIQAVLREKLTADLGLFIPELDALFTDDAISFVIEKVTPSAVSNIIEKSSKVEDREEQTEQQILFPPKEDLGPEDLSKKNASATIIAIYRAQQFDPYNREIIVGFPLLAGKIDKNNYCAPLFYYKVKLDFDSLRNLVTLTKEFEIPALNFHFLKSILDSDEEIEIVRKDIIPSFYEEEFGQPTIKDIIQKLSTLIPKLHSLYYDQRHFSELSEALAKRNSPQPIVLNSCIIANVKRSNAYLLDDLSELANLQQLNCETAVDAILNEPINKESVEDLEDPQNSSKADLLFYPFPSNRSQRIVAAKAQTARLMVIQGPPGTGKSQTIVNLVSHLVALGKTVLISSHQNKALEVITNNLPKIEYLAMSLFKGERKSINELTNKIEGFGAYVSNVNVTESEKRLTEYRNRLHGIREDMLRLQGRFSELKNLERDKYPDYYSYNSIRQYYFIDGNDSLPPGNDKLIAIALKQYRDVLLKVKSDYDCLFSLLGSNPPILPGEREMVCPCCGKAASLLMDSNQDCRCSSCQGLIANGVASNINNVTQIIKCYELLRDTIHCDRHLLEQSRVLVNEQISYEDTINYFSVLSQWLNTNGHKFVAILNDLSENYDFTINVKKAGNTTLRYWDDINSILNRLRQVGSIIRSENRYESEERFPTYPDNKLLEEIVSAVNKLRSASWLSWKISRRMKGARDLLRFRGFGGMTYRNRTSMLKGIEKWREYWFYRNQIVNDLKTLLKIYALDQNISKDISFVELTGKLHFIELVSEAYQLLKDIPRCNVKKVQGVIEGRLANITSYEKCKAMRDDIDKIGVFFKAMAANLDCRRGLPFATLCKTVLLPVDKSIMELSINSDGDQIVNEIKNVMKYFPDYMLLKKLETTKLKGLENTIKKLTEKVIKFGNNIEILDNPETVIRAYHLSQFMKNDLLRNPDDLNEVTTKMKTLREESFSLIVKILEIGRRLSLKRAEANPIVLSQINKLKQILKKKKKTFSFMQFREQIDYRKLLNVFPAWVMSIDDVARIFPLEGGLFDYLIIDEASQCNQATILHLAFRAKRMIVVGDEKQMKNPNTQFLADAVVRLNLTKHKLDGHPNAIFLHGRNSLLDLALGCQDTSPVFLNEHFRPEPPIIEFSNSKFYDNRLKILTPFRKKRFSPCMEIRLVSGGFDDPDDTKQNKIEARAVIEELTRLVENGDLEGDNEGERLTVGILSPFRMQASLLQNMVYEKFSENPKIIGDFGITVSTVDGFQGDEKDIIIYSLRYAGNSKPGTINAIQRADEHALGRLNVAFSRARRKVIAFISVPKETFPKGLIREYLDHVSNIQNSHYQRFGNPNEREKCQSDFERDVFDRLVNRGLIVYSQVPCAGFYIDFVIFDDKGRRIALECDGEFHYDEGELREEDYQRQDIIERYGWAVYRMSSRNYYANPERGINKIIDFLMSQAPDIEVIMDKMEVGKEVFGAETVEPKTEEDGEAMKEEPEGPELEEWKETQTEKESFQEIEKERQAEKIGVQHTESEKDILDVLSVHGDLRVYEISMKTDFGREEVIDILNVLLEKGFVECYFENRVKVWHRIEYDIKKEELHNPRVKENSRNIFVDSKMWFELAKWGRETGKLNKDLINFAYKAGERIKKNWELSPFNKRKMADLWKMVTAQGFIPRKHFFDS